MRVLVRIAIKNKSAGGHGELAGGVFDGRVWRRELKLVNIFGMAELVRARRRRAPVRIPATSRGWRAWTRPLLRTAIAATPRIVPGTEPMPPKILVPPR